VNVPESELISAIDPRQARHWELNGVRRIRVGATVLGVTLFIFACHSYFAYAAERMAAVSLSACVLSLVAFYLASTRQETLVSSNVLTASLYAQVFGEMLLNGGLSAPATPLVTLIVPAAYLLWPHGSRSILTWCLLVGLSLLLVAFLESTGLTLTNELGPAAQRLDKLMSLVLGVLCTTYLTQLFANQARAALEQLARERMQYRQQALFDSLTGLPNRDHFFAHADQCLQEASGGAKVYDLIFLDVDRFKRINDTMGHAHGDALLEQVGARLLRLASTELFAARLAGDEFIVMSEVHDTGLTGEQLLEHFRTVFSQPFDLGGQQLTVSLSAGIARFPDDGLSLAALMNSADQRMYESKAKGPTRNQSKANPSGVSGSAAESSKPFTAAQL